MHTPHWLCFTRPAQCSIDVEREGTRGRNPPLSPTPHTLLPRLITLCPHSPLPSLGCRVGPPLSPLERSHYVCSSSRCRVSCRPKRGGPSRSWASNHLRSHPCCSACTRAHTHAHAHAHAHTRATRRCLLVCARAWSSRVRAWGGASRGGGVEAMVKAPLPGSVQRGGRGGVACNHRGHACTRMRTRVTTPPP